jgi:hypothetical protein
MGYVLVTYSTFSHYEELGTTVLRRMGLVSSVGLNYEEQRVLHVHSHL